MTHYQPTRQEVKVRLIDLLAGRASREEVANWAAHWVIADDPGVEDEVVWESLTVLVGADLETAPGVYLHAEPDFEDWLYRVDSPG